MFSKDAKEMHNLSFGLFSFSPYFIWEACIIAIREEGTARIKGEKLRNLRIIITLSSCRHPFPGSEPVLKRIHFLWRGRFCSTCAGS